MKGDCMSDISKFFTDPEFKKAFQQYYQAQSKNTDTGEPKQDDTGTSQNAGKIEPQAIPYELAERMAIMGEECEPDQVQPYIADFGVLVIPFNSNPKYHYWNKGQSICTTLKELGRCDLIEKYTHPDYFDGN